MKTDAIWQADVQQRVFRHLVESFSRPGEVQDLNHCMEADNAQLAVLASLMDGETTLADPHAQIAAAHWPLLQARKVATDFARYITADGQRPPDFQPALGSLESPEFGATVLIKVYALDQGPLTMQLSGPGIPGQRELRVQGLHVEWLRQRADWVAGFPLGVDIVLCDATRIAALPRTTRIAINGLMTSLTEGDA